MANCLPFLKVPSGQIRSSWAWYHWIGLTSIGFWFFILNFWKEYKVLSLWLQKCLQSPYSLAGGLYRILSSYSLAHYYLMKKSAKVLHYFSLDCGLLEFFKYSTYKLSSKHKMYSSRIFWRTIWRKRLRFVHIQPTCRRSGMIRWIFVWSSSELWTLIKI